MDILDRLSAAAKNTLEKGILRTEPDGFQWLMTESDFLGRANLPMTEYAKILKIREPKQEQQVNLLCLHGRQDSTIPWEESEIFAEMSGASLVVIDGDHNYRQSEDAKAMIDEVVKFCRKSAALGS